MLSEETIIQMTSMNNILFGLSSKGRLFYWNSNMKDWTIYDA